jgi:tetratricopeptide (TPR) repeat protein
VSELDERGLGGGRAWTFKHILIRDVAYDTIPKAERSRAHDAFGRWLESTAAERLGEYADIVSYHAEQAFLLAHELGDTGLAELGGRGYRHLFAGGLNAERRGDQRAALAFFRRALAIADAIDLPAAVRLETRARVANVRMALEESQEVLDEIAALVAQLRTIPPTTVLVDLLGVLSFDLSDKDLAGATALDREATAAARVTRDPETIASAIIRSAWAPWVNGDLDAQRRALAEAQEQIDRTGAQRHLTELFGWLGANAAMSGRFVEAERYSAQAIERAAASGSAIQRAVTRRGAVWTAIWAGELDQAVIHGQAAVDAAIDAGARAVIGVNYWFLGDVFELAGRHEEARVAYERSVEHLSGAPSQGLRAEARTRLTKPLIGLGRVAEARLQAETARGEVAAHDVLTLATAAAALAAVMDAERRADDADQLYRDALGTIGPTGYALIRMQIQRDYAHFLIDKGRGAEAKPLLEEVRAFYDTPETSFERQRTEALLQRCATVPR